MVNLSEDAIKVLLDVYNADDCIKGYPRNDYMSQIVSELVKYKFITPTVPINGIKSTIVTIRLEPNGKKYIEMLDKQEK